MWVGSPQDAEARTVGCRIRGGRDLRWRTRLGLPVACEYDLHGSPAGQCRECGTPAAVQFSDGGRGAPARRWAACWAIAAVAAAMVTVWGVSILAIR